MGLISDWDCSVFFLIQSYWKICLSDSRYYSVCIILCFCIDDFIYNYEDHAKTYEYCDCINA